MWKSGIKTDSELNADVSLSRVSIDANGRLVVELRTRTRFRGLFLESLDKQGNLKNEESSFIAPMGVRTNFTLELVWSQDTFDGAEQVNWNFPMNVYNPVLSTGKQSLNTAEKTTLASTHWAWFPVLCSQHKASNQAPVLLASARRKTRPNSPSKSASSNRRVPCLSCTVWTRTFTSQTRSRSSSARLASIHLKKWTTEALFQRAQKSTRELCGNLSKILR